STQRDEMADAEARELPRHRIDVLARAGDRGQMCGGRNWRSFSQFTQQADGPVAAGAASAIGYRHEVRPQGLQPGNAIPDSCLPFWIASRKKLERYCGFTDDAHAVSLAALSAAIRRRGSLAIQIRTTSLPPA